MNSILTLILFFLLSGMVTASCPGTPADCYTKTGANPYTYTAIDCSQHAVQASINAASDNDMVIMPAGTCSWTSKGTGVYAITFSGKAINLIGAGIGNTVINSTSGKGSAYPGEGIFWVKTTNVKRFRISGFTLNGSQASSNPVIFAIGPWQDFRIDHVRFVLAGQRAIFVDSNFSPFFSYGLIDANEFYPTVAAQSIQTRNTKGSPPGNLAWQTATQLGIRNQVYIENNTFSYPVGHNATSPILDSDYGGSWVIRYNDIIQSHVHTHGGYEYSNYPTADRRGTRQFELYNNKWTSNGKISGTSAAQIRGGVGVIFNNVITGQYDRYCGSGNAFCMQCYAGAAGSCIATEDGTGTNGQPCRDCPGAGQDVDNGTFPRPQTTEPTYIWNNTINGSVATAGDNAHAVLTAGVDYINNAPKQGYTPYTGAGECPHPLAAASGFCIASGAGKAGYNVGNKKD